MYDTALLGGLIVDGKRTKPYISNLYIKDGKIAKISPDILEAKERVEVQGLAVAPGFIDIHTHSDSVPFHNIAPNSMIRQGVTTEVIGNCGASNMPGLEESRQRCEEYNIMKRNHKGFLTVTDYEKAINELKPQSNYAPLLGHSNLRMAVMGFVNRDPDEAEMEKLKALLEREMSRGAFGMSLGLIYPPSAFSSKEELVELAKIIAKYDGILSVHMRNEGPRIFEAVDEMIEIAERSGVHVEISHLKLMGTPQWGKAPQLIAKLDEARARGLNITCDQYPFPASSTALSALVPHWAHDGGRDAMIARVRDEFETVRPEIEAEMANRGGPAAILVATATNGDAYLRKTIQQIADELGVTPAEAVRAVLVDTDSTCQCIYFCINEDDIHHIMKQLYVCVGSDGSGYDYNSPKTPHPRNYSAFSKYFQTVREHNIHPLEDMVFKATGLTASILGIRDRGTLTEGNWADIAVFDPAHFGSQSTFTEPKMPPVGMHHVLVNGVFAVRDNAQTGLCAGMAVLK